MDFSGDDFYDDEVTSGHYDDDPNPYDGTLSEGGDDEGAPEPGPDYPAPAIHTDADGEPIEYIWKRLEDADGTL